MSEQLLAAQHDFISSQAQCELFTCGLTHSIAQRESRLTVLGPACDPEMIRREKLR